MPLTNANDSTGYIGTGGIQYIQNKYMQMKREDLYLSKKQIKVDYQFQNLSDRDITENILFPLHKVQNYIEYDYADVTGLVDSFTVTSNGKKIKPQIHVRAFLPSTEAEYVEDGDFQADVTEELKSCDLNDKELMQPWTFENMDDEVKVNQKVANCTHPKVKQLLAIQDEDTVRWQSQIIYSWQQQFKANEMTKISHQYQPLVGGSLGLGEEVAKAHCVDQNIQKVVDRGDSYGVYSGLSYILKTGANWAKSIDSFNVTIERDDDELLSLCWDGEVKKVSKTQFKITEKNFKPKHDLNLIFIQRKNVK
ncbi:DUF4424 family protein [Acinetobacter sp.]|uniref:DUF4424 family protein n=1 Tax=Acinetobacter sp. TaxID=472 RepID=UPI0035AF06E4